ncbi:filamentous hemagglutinin N-terminal domain-containing protein [Nostoc sp. CHAB 5784]|uniref:two-partner secretion domain-containing protein n=1 Tax=Nostoc mirabile TaxID=2907820 RepID=UPI001E5E7654|nr:filamentous hemagglutinin N-terminal domain-containing protein [Nostoc mirabile]MCC5668063.1 filamentous hemagglutinin N-terminal domain-containing protein [Nostoc mirabile CHAB5784]
MNQADHPEKASIKNILCLCLISTVLSQASPAQAQITPDNTLSSEASQLNQNLIINGALGDKIDGGATRGSNLFHSFSEFNIQDGQRVYFANPSGIENILTRVTGGNASNIFGTLGVDGAANLFLINPNGILFGQNARLDVQGSFVGTTANGVQFGNQGIFSATNPQAPPLLTIQPSALWFNQLNPGAAIQNNSVAPAGIDAAGFNAYGLRVADGKSLLLVGGNVSMDGGELNAYGGRVELGGLAAPGNVNLLFNGDNLSLKFPENVTRAEVSLTNQARVYVEASGSGDIAINARNIDILRGSLLNAGIAEGLGKPETTAGDITLNATGEIKVADSGSKIRNLVREDSKGNGGNIFIDSGDFSLSDGAQLEASTSGVGNAGNVTVGAKNAISLANSAQIATSTLGKGNAGNIQINADDSVFVSNGSVIQAATFGQGNAGSITIEAGNTISFDGVGSNNITTGAYSVVGPFAIPSPELIEKNINIRARSLSLVNSAQIATSTIGKANAGNIQINADDSVFVSNGSVIQAATIAQGNGGNIFIDSGSFSLRDGAELEASTSGVGNAGNVTVRAKNAVDLANANILSAVEAGGVGKGGNIDINAATLSLTDSAQLLTITRAASATQPAGRGDAGNVNLKITGAVDIAGEKNDFKSGIRSNLGTGTVGNGGNIFIDSGSFSLRDGAELNASTSGVGNAGNVTVIAKDAISLANGDILSAVEAGGVGKGGNIDINAATLSLTDSAQLLTITRAASATQPAGRGDAGNVNVKVTGAVDIAGKKNDFSSGIRSNVGTGTVGNGGNIFIDSGSFSLRDGAELEASTSGVGNAGNVTVRAKDTVSLAGGDIFSDVETGGVGNSGGINIRGSSLSLTDDAQLSASTFGQGNAGNVIILAKDKVSFSGSNSEVFSAVGLLGIGNGANINIRARSLSLANSALIATSTLGKGNAGNIQINADDSVFVSNGSVIVPATFGQGNAGSITIEAGNTISFDGVGSNNISTGAYSVVGPFAIPSPEFTGKRSGGDITIKAERVSLTNSAKLNASTSGVGNAGNVTVRAKNAVDLANGDILSAVEAGGVGKGGNIYINAATLSLTHSAQLLTITRAASATQPAGQGDAGNVNVLVTGAVDIIGEKNGFPSGIRSNVGTGTVGNGGNISIDSGSFSLRDGAQLSASTYGQGNAGNVTVIAKDAITVSGTSQESKFSSALFTFTDSTSTGIGGDITVNTNIFRVSDGALLDARTRNNQKGGDITINANIFEALNGGQLTTTTSSNGRAGKITVNADDKLIISGIDSNYSDRITNFPDNVANIGANSGLFVSSTGSGITGDIEINSPKITLDNQGKLNAESASGNGGNINLNSDLLLLRRNSQISTNAGTEKLGGNGGNININSKFIVAVPNENSDISANAFTGTGGNIQINSQGIFGIESRTKPTKKSDITASSELGVLGVTNINTPDNSSIQNSLTELSPNVINTNALIANSCISRATKRQENSFTITGSGALRNSPGDVLISAYTTGDVRSVEPTSRPWKKGDPIIEPQGLYRLPNGQLILSRSCST